MHGTPPYVVRTSSDEADAIDLDDAIATASDLYDPADEVPDIVDANGRIIFDPARVVELIIQYRASKKA